MTAVPTPDMVKALLQAASLTVSDEEFQHFAHTYPLIRGQVEALYAMDLESESPALRFGAAETH